MIIVELIFDDVLEDKFLITRAGQRSIEKGMVASEIFTWQDRLDMDSLLFPARFSE